MTLARRLLALTLALACLPMTFGGLAGVPDAAWAEAEGAWQSVKSQDQGIEAEFPAPPRYEAVQLLSGQGFPYTMHQYLSQTEAKVFQMQTAIYPRDVYLTPQVNIQVGLDAAAKTLQDGRWSNVNWTRHQGLMAADAVGTRAGQEIRMFSLLKGMRLVTLTYVGPPETARSEPVERFFRSLKVQ